MLIARSAFLTGAALSVCGTAARGASGDADSVRIDGLVARAMRELPIRAVSIVVARDGAPIVAAGYGIADARAGLRASAATVYPIGSITKTFTASVILALRDARSVDLDAPIATYVREAPHGNAITVRMLLQHRSGLADVFGDFAWETRMQHATAEQMVATVRDEPLHFAPGTQFEYANTNYLLLGLAIERITRMPLAAVLRRDAIVPAGLQDTALVGDAVSRRAIGFQRQTDADGAPIDIPNGARMYWGAGGLASTALDLARWDAALLDGRILRASSVDEMMAAPAAPAGSEAYAMGWDVDVFHGERRVRHAGNVPGFSCSNAVLRDRKLSIAVLTNLSRIPVDMLADRIALAVLRLPDPGGPIFG